jgi:hypothetical protein
MLSRATFNAVPNVRDVMLSALSIKLLNVIVIVMIYFLTIAFHLCLMHPPIVELLVCLVAVYHGAQYWSLTVRFTMGLNIVVLQYSLPWGTILEAYSRVYHGAKY